MATVADGSLGSDNGIVKTRVPSPGYAHPVISEEDSSFSPQ